jgi:selenocysteine lyase/cysteine desulfurase
MEHHSNHTSWFETAADVEVIGHTPELEVDLNDLEDKLKNIETESIKLPQ